MTTHSVTGHLEELFKLLDAAQFAPVTILTTEKHKQHYESLLTFAFRKLQAARYHTRQVSNLIERHHAHFDHYSDEIDKDAKLKISEITIKTSQSAGEFAFELSAFFAAIRSAIDFLARVSTEHSKNNKVESVQSLLKFVEQGKTNPALQVIAAHAAWLKHLRDYRDQVVHYLVLSTVSGGQKQWKGGRWVITSYPIVVPSETPKVVHDTRLVRAMDEPQLRFMTSTSEGWFTDEEGKKHMLHHTVEFEPGPGYMRIEELMNREMEAFEAFFSELLLTLIKLKFAPAPIT